MSDVVQTSLFSDRVLFLNIVKDGRRVNMSFAEIFDPARYESLYAVTFVSSPAFFFETAKKFRKVRLVLGIEDYEELEPFGDYLKAWLDPERKTHFWKLIDEETREKILKGDISVRFPHPSYPVHSKFYLLEGLEGKRVVVGSANFTSAALRGRKQFEELLVFDDPSLFELYLERFQEIEGVALDYISDKLKKKLRAGEVVLLSTPEELVEEIAADLERLERIEPLDVSNERMRLIKGRVEVIEKSRKDEETFQKTVKILSEEKKNRISAPKKAKTINALKVAVANTKGGAQECDHRIWLCYNEKDDLLYYCDGRGDNCDLLVPFSRQATVESLKRNLLALSSFVESYEKYTNQKDPASCARVFEVILYAFMGPYIWKIKDHCATLLGRDSVRADFPSFLFLYGVSRAGKTTLFEVLERLLGNNMKPMSYEAVSKHLYNYFRTENLMPLLVDEVPEKFMTSTARYLGERLIKIVSNDLRGKHPVMIGASNSDRFSIPPQVQRRVCFIKVSSTFEESDEARAHLSRVMDEVDSNLFRDFTWRLGRKIANREEFYRLSDPLAVGRSIFLEYYAQCGMSVPQWFPRRPVDDYAERGRAYWRHAYRMKRSAFKEAGNGRLVVDLDLIASRQDRDFATNLLPPECLGDKLANTLELKKEEFLRFIGGQNGAMRKAFMSVFRTAKKK